MAQDKFTPYALTALPAAQDRDVNGIYFIRVPNGMEIYAIADTPAKTAVPLKVVGYVDLTSPQHIDGRKTFNNIGLKLIQGLYHMPQANGDALIYHLEDSNGRNGLQIIANKDSNHKSMYLDISDLQVTGTDLRVEYLEQSLKVQGEKNLEGEAVNYLGWKKVFDITAYQIDLTANAIRTIELTPGALPVLAWDNGQAFMQGTHWDIVWEAIAGQVYRKFSLKGTYGKHVLDTTQIRRASTGQWQLRLAVDIDLTIPEGAKLVIW